MLSQLVNKDGAERAALGGRARETVVSQLGSKYGEAVLRGGVFAAAIDASGAAPGTAIGTTAFLALENPLGSGVALVVLKASIGYHSGTLGAGYMAWCVDDNPASAVPIATSTALTRVPCLIGDGSSPRGIAHETATLLNAPTLLRPAFSLDASMASSVVGREALVDHVDGEFVLLPGTVIALEADAAAGTSPLLAGGIVWEEIPL